MAESLARFSIAALCSRTTNGLTNWVPNLVVFLLSARFSVTFSDQHLVTAGGWVAVQPRGFDTRSIALMVLFPTL